MLKSGTISILRTFQPAEIRQFDEFIRSPFHNKNQSVIKLYGHLRRLYPDFDAGKLAKRTIYKKVFPNALYNDGFMRKVIFGLRALAEEFLAISHYNKYPVRKELGLLVELENRKLDKILSKTFRKTESKIEKSDLRDDEYYHNMHQLGDIKKNFIFRKKSITKNLRDYDKKILYDTMDSLNQFYLIKALTGYRHLLFKKKHEKIDIEYEFIDELYNLVKNNESFYGDNTVLKMHINEANLLKEEDPKYYFILKKILMENNTSISDKKKYSLLNILYLFISVKRLDGNSEYWSEGFELTKIAVKNELYKLPGKNYMDESFFINAVFESSRLKEYAWAETFVNKYSKLLAPENQMLLVCYCKARLSFRLGNNEKALQQLSKITSVKHSLFRVLINTLFLQIYYELLMYEQAYSLIDSYRHFLKKTKAEFSEIRLEVDLNFMKCVTALFKASEKSDLGRLMIIRTELEKGLKARERTWLLDKAAALEKRLIK